MRFPILVLLHLCLCFLVVQTLSKTTESGATERGNKPKENKYSCIGHSRTLEAWNGHDTGIKRVHADATISRVDVYTEAKNKDSLNKQIFSFTTQVWEYMIHKYGRFGPDLCLILMIHQSNHTSGHPVYSLNNKQRVNVLDLSFKRQNAWIAWSSHDINEELDLITNHLAYFVEFSSNDRNRSVSYNVWKGYNYKHTAWVDIFTYDVYTTLNYTQHAQRYKNKSLERSDETHFPKNETFWFRDWFLPIYELRGGNAALRKYFELLRDYTAIKSEMNVGSFVHFWSAAAQLDLKYLAEKAFGWNVTYQQELENARSTVKLSQFYNVTSETNSSNDFHTHDVKGIPTKATSTTPTQLENDFSDDPLKASTNVLHTTPAYPNDSKSTVSPFENKVKPLETKSDTNDVKLVTIVVSASAAVIVVIILISILCILFYKKKIHNLQTEIRTLTTQEVEEFFDGDPNANVNFNDDQALIQSMPFIKDYEIPKDQIILARDKVIGTGQFGYVLHGFVRFSGQSELVKVAVKMMRPNVDVVYFKAFLSEVKIMAYLGKHENIVDLMGTCTENIKEREIFIALELCPLGNLHDFLRDNRHLFQGNEGKKQSIGFIQGLQLNYRKSLNPNYPAERELRKITNLDLAKWSKEIANAMIYLKYKKVIHGDLAARNILLTANRTAKICDFGLSRQVLNYSNYMKTSKTPVPWRWLAIECMQEQKFSTASDVWAYGVLIWEIFSLGETPYGCYTYDLTFANKLISGERLLQPVYASPEIYKLMHNCWKINPEERISFQQIHDTLQILLQTSPHLTFDASPRNSLKCSAPPFLKVEVEATRESHL